MTASGDFIPNEPNFDAAPAYPVIFGIPITPAVGGVLMALVGLCGGAYLLLNLTQPEWDKYQQLDAKVKDKRQQVEQQQAIAQQVDKAKQNLEVAKQQRDSVLALFANESTLNTLLLDINRQIESRNANLPAARQAKLAACPAWVRANLQDIETKTGDLVSRARLRKFTPDPKLSGVINDGSYGALVNNKLKRQAGSVTLEGNFIQTQQILSSLERLQPLLVVKNLEATVGTTSQLFEIAGNAVQFLPNCQPDPKITTTFQLEALLPLTPEEMKAANPAPAPSPK